ncbi:uncharacterized protein LOC136033328 [Artemia franciscana]|uniref:uncharacterized protein LOC136033328 n=1 Tax=Artemia franciscana TaxID=6661 RepID=UPI0032D9FE3F
MAQFKVKPKYERLCAIRNDGLTDIAKAFDKVPHSRLHSKLTAVGIDKRLVDWLMDFRGGRTQKVWLFTMDGGKIYSTPCQVLSSVPQGTVLGLTLFLIYINDLVVETKNHLTLYTDDSKLFGTVDNISLQANLNQIQAWADKWLLSFNISKCVTLHFSRGNLQHQYTMYNSKTSSTVLIPTSSSGRDLGVLLDDSLKFHEHTAQAVSKANANLGLLKRTVSSRSSTVFLKLYKALVRPILDFGTCLAGPFYKSEVQLVEGVQRRATKCINGLCSQPYCRRLQSVNLPTLVFQQADQKLFTFSPHQKHTRGLSKKLFKSSVNTKV